MAEMPRPLRVEDLPWERWGGTDLICVSSGTSESDSESTTFSSDLYLEFSRAFFGGTVLLGAGEDAGCSFGADFAVGSFFEIVLTIFFFELIMAPPTLRTGFSASSSTGRLAGILEGVVVVATGESNVLGVVATGRGVPKASLSVLFFGISVIGGVIFGSLSIAGNRATTSFCFFSTMSLS